MLLGVNAINFETKHLIRWGIPGWIFLLFVLLNAYIGNLPLMDFMETNNDIAIIGIAATLTAIGVPVGYVIHQVSMLFGFVVWNNWKKYYKHEFDLDLIMMQNINADKLKSRFVHLLTRVHELRALTFSFLLSFLTSLTLVPLLNIEISKYLLASYILNFFLCAVSYVNQKYFEGNLKYLTKQIKQL